MSTARYVADISDQQWPPELMTNEQFFIAKGIFCASDQRLRRVVAGPEGLRAGPRRLRAGKSVWYTTAPLPLDGREVTEGIYPKFSFWYSGYLLALANLRRRRLIIEDPACPAGDVLMLANQAKEYVAEVLMCCVRSEARQRARFFGPRDAWVCFRESEPSLGNLRCRPSVP
jgi:hypothetical protein